MCCGQKRSMIKGAPTLAAAPLVARQAMSNIRYIEQAPIQVRGAATGRAYQFSGAHPVAQVTPADAPSLMRLRFFRHA